MSTTMRGRWLAVNFAATIFVSAFLLFQIEPLVSKYILPWFGGTPGSMDYVPAVFSNAAVLRLCLCPFQPSVAQAEATSCAAFDFDRGGAGVLAWCPATCGSQPVVWSL